MVDRVLFQEIVDVLIPSTVTMIKYSSRKVQCDFSFRLIFHKKLIEMFHKLANLHET